MRPAFAKMMANMMSSGSHGLTRDMAKRALRVRLKVLCKGILHHLNNGPV